MSNLSFKKAAMASAAGVMAVMVSSAAMAGPLTTFDPNHNWDIGLTVYAVNTSPVDLNGNSYSYLETIKLDFIGQVIGTTDVGGTPASNFQILSLNSGSVDLTVSETPLLGSATQIYNSTALPISLASASSTNPYGPDNTVAIEKGVSNGVALDSNGIGFSYLNGTAFGNFFIDPTLKSPLPTKELLVSALPPSLSTTPNLDNSANLGAIADSFGFFKQPQYGDYLYTLVTFAASYNAQELPAPAPLAMIGVGLLGLGWSRRRRAA